MFTTTPRFSTPVAKANPGERARRYTPPPSPARDLSIARFESSVNLDDVDTPALLHSRLLDRSTLNDSFAGLSMSTSSPSVAFTPTGYATARLAQETSFTGLGLFMQDGSMFDGMGPLPKREPLAAGWTDGYDGGDDLMSNDDEPWKKRLSFNGKRMFSPTGQAFDCSSPAARQSAARTPTMSDEHDVFGRSPQACTTPSAPATTTTRHKRTRHHRRDSAAVVMRWFQQVQEAQGSDAMTEVPEEC